MSIIATAEYGAVYPLGLEPQTVQPSNWNPQHLGSGALALTGYEACMYAASNFDPDGLPVVADLDLASQLMYDEGLDQIAADHAREEAAQAWTEAQQLAADAAAILNGLFEEGQLAADAATILNESLTEPKHYQNTTPASGAEGAEQQIDLTKYAGWIDLAAEL